MEGSRHSKQCATSNAFVEEDDRYKYSDELIILGLIMLADILIKYNFLA